MLGVQIVGLMNAEPHFSGGPFPRPSAQPLAESKPLSLPRLHRGLVFVIDDEDNFRDSIEELFEDNGFLVLTARSGAEALARMEGISTRAVAIVDLNMPGMGGRELIEHMKRDEAMKHIPVLVVTGQAKPNILGVHRVLKKTVCAHELLEIVKGLCSL